MQNNHNGFWKSALQALLMLTTVLAGNAFAGTVQFDPVFGLPIPPIDLPYDHSRTMSLLSTMIIPGCIALGYAIWEGLKKKSLLPVAIVMSSVLLVFTEVFVDVVGGVFYPISKEHNLITIFGRQTNFIVLGWLFSSVFILLAYKLIERGVSTRALWITFVGGALFNFAQEETFLNIFTPYVYYGNQPLILLNKFPLWWGFCTFGSLFCAAALAHYFRQAFRGWKALLMILITPMVFGGFYGFAALPALIVINGDYSWAVIQAGGVLTILMACSAVALAIKLLLRRDPFVMGSGLARSSPQ